MLSKNTKKTIIATVAWQNQDNQKLIAIRNKDVGHSTKRLISIRRNVSKDEGNLA